MDLTTQQVKDSPSLASDKPVSTQHLAELHGYYGWAPMWSGPATVWSVPVPFEHAEAQGDPHLRSARNVTGYTIQAKDGTLGHVEDFIAEVGSPWVIRYVVFDTNERPIYWK